MRSLGGFCSNKLEKRHFVSRFSTSKKIVTLSARQPSLSARIPSFPPAPHDVFLVIRHPRLRRTAQGDPKAAYQHNMDRLGHSSREDGHADCARQFSVRLRNRFRLFFQNFDNNRLADDALPPRPPLADLQPGARSGGGRASPEHPRPKAGPVSCPGRCLQASKPL